MKLNNLIWAAAAAVTTGIVVLVLKGQKAQTEIIRSSYPSLDETFEEWAQEAADGHDRVMDALEKLGRKSRACNDTEYALMGCRDCGHGCNQDVSKKDKYYCVHGYESAFCTGCESCVGIKNMMDVD